jgi:hypothetical protein
MNMSKLVSLALIDSFMRLTLVDKFKKVNANILNFDVTFDSETCSHIFAYYCRTN